MRASHPAPCPAPSNPRATAAVTSRASSPPLVVPHFLLLLRPLARLEQPSDFVLGDLEHAAARDTLEAERPEVVPDQAVDVHAERVAHLADLAVLALAARELEPLVRPRVRPPTLERHVHLAVADTVDRDASLDLVELVLLHVPVHPHAVDALEARTGQLEVAGELAVAGEEDEPLRVHVEPTDELEPRQRALELEPHLRHPLEHGRPPLGV
mmetsp:Transcript_7514/g.18008  ORF Transcript_7514/g.18008 Transcript_7514/m.18008 type:complete len:212 (+) Transcript_7514:242-877(+)